MPFRSVLALALLLLLAACAPSAREARWMEDSYDCTRDEQLRRAPRVPAADTAGLGARVARAFPAYRLSTEREIACRFPLGDGSTPAMFWEGWGSGRAWWRFRGDFDGDGRPDDAVILTSRSDPGQDLLGVLFADGRAAEVGGLGGWGVAVGPRRGEVLESFDGEEEPVTLSVDALTVIYWEKASTAYYWNGKEFVAVATGD